ncbi:MAG: RluA family pseudouridine synthase [Treponema sp.]|nr:RluA family pseudouridine synthase [Treponema sp.]
MKRPLFTLIHEDENIAVFNKSSGISVSPDRWDPSIERLDRLAAEFIKIPKLYTVHRIDKETSGLVIFAKNDWTHKALSSAFEKRKVKKRYIAAVNGRPSQKEIVCDLPLVPNGNKKHMTIIDKFRGKESITTFRLLGSAGNYSILEAMPETGRTHQIRVHLASLGHTVVGDDLYGNGRPVKLSAFKKGWQGNPKEERPLISRLGLHAYELFLPGYPEGRPQGRSQSLEGPTGLSLKAPIPKDMSALIKQMEKVSGNTIL